MFSRSDVFQPRSGFARTLVAALIAGLAGTSLAARAPSAKSVLEKFLSLDADAAGLAPATWPELGRYTTWPGAPSWDGFVVIDRYEIGRVIEGHTRAQGTVVYHPLGKLTSTFTADTAPETVVYHLNKVRDEWKVDGPQLMPHVAYDVMKRRIEARSASDPKMKAANDALLAQIEAARQKAK